MAKNETEQVDVVVVGTGWNGLICGKTYLDFEPEASLLFLDQGNSIGGVWSEENIYPTLYAQIRYGQFEYSFYPMRREGITADGYISGGTINKYLNDFAETYGLARRTRLRTKVDQVSRIASPGSGAAEEAEYVWRLSIEGGHPIECKKLIYASGATSHPVIPSWPSSAGFNAPIIHSADTGKHLDLIRSIKRATVVGAAKSAYDTVFLLLDAGVKVDWIIREDDRGSGPLAIMPPTILGLVNTMDFVATRMVGVLGASIMAADGVGYQFFHKTLLGDALRRAFWKTVNIIAEHHAGYSWNANAKKLRPLPHGNGIFWASSGLGAASVPNYWKTFHSGSCTVHRTEIEHLGDGNTIRLRSGDEVTTDCLLLCTGFDKSYQPFSQKLQRQCDLAPDPDPHEAARWAKLDVAAEKTVDEMFPVLRRPPQSLIPAASDSSNKYGRGGQTKGKDGSKTLLHHGPNRHYRRLISPSLASQGDRSVIFPGFIHSIYTPLVSEVQALWGVAFLLDMLELPARGAMEDEVALWHAWSRKRYPTQGRKHAYSIYDFLSYIDILLKDLGINTRRRLNPLAHLLVPARPRDFRGLLEEFRRVRAGKFDKQGYRIKLLHEGGPGRVGGQHRVVDVVVAKAISLLGSFSDDGRKV
ncbi:hypothetical protein N8I77_013392 [Diaporthe amygdali]|uniref:Uncharacterized protein n=1 Tax=Phomopsis amygdali TaxID=1214568 RepID=A0AAD9S1E6_PHOAM|nr:hypothetical protein N8I77_013392 [Diaporthe amygdali]